MRVLASTRAGVTLLELLVVLVILSVLAGVVGIAARTPARTPVDPVRDTIAQLRTAAIDDGIPVSRVLRLATGTLASVTATPDGRVVADSMLHVDQLTGERAADATR